MIGGQVYLLGALQVEGQVLLRFLLALAPAAWAPALLLHYFLFVLKECPTVWPRLFLLVCTCGLTLYFRRLFADDGGALPTGAPSLSLSLLVAAYLLLDVYAAKLVEVLQKGPNRIVLHISLPTYLQGLQIVRKVVIDDFDTGVEVNELVVGVGLPAHYRLALRSLVFIVLGLYPFFGGWFLCVLLSH